MSCYDCAEKFSFFKKEVGCANCGFGFCSKCCSQKAVVPRKDNKVLNVCRKCHKLLTESKSAAAVPASNPRLARELSPPANFLKLVEQNNSKIVAGPRSHPSQGPRAQATDPTKALEERLMKLKERPDQSKPIPNDEELASRLNQIKGTNPETQKLSNLPGKQIVNTPDDLIKQFMEEVEIEKKHGDFEQEQIEKLEQRLRNLSEGVVTNKPEEANAAADGPRSKTEELASARISSANSMKSRDLVKKFLAEAENDYKKQTATEEDDETWCCLCNGDAQFKCIDCDGDYYCKRCFKQSHDTYEYKQHRRQPIAESN